MAQRSMTWDLDRIAIARVVHMPEVAAHLVALARAGKAQSERLSPRGATGRYGSSHVVGPVEVDGMQVSTSFGSTDSAAHIVERGSVNNPPYMVLHRAAHALGLKIEKA